MVGPRTKKSKKTSRRYRSDVLYFCTNCGNYSWRTGGQMETDGRRPEGFTRKVIRTCNDCKKRGHV